MVAAQEEEAVWVSACESEEQQDDFEGEVAAINVVPEEEIGSLEATMAQNPDKILQVPMNVSDNDHWSGNLEKGWLCLESLSRNFQQHGDRRCGKRRNWDVMADRIRWILLRGEKGLEAREEHINTVKVFHPLLLE
jgi:hypothetical protein